MAYKTCENCGSRVFNHGCVNCDEMEYISMQGAYDSREVAKVISSNPPVMRSVCSHQNQTWNADAGVNVCDDCNERC